MAVERIVPNLPAQDSRDGECFFAQVLGLETAMALDFITTYRSASGALISVLAGDPSGLHPDYSVGVDDVDACLARAQAEGVEIVYGPTDEPWGVRRFFVRDPLGKIANIVEHRN